MHNVTFKHRKSIESRKKDIFLREVVEKDGVISTTERRCFYSIKDIENLAEGQDLKKWMDLQTNSAPLAKRHFYILKEHNECLGADKLICKIAGVFYAIMNKRMYTIAFLQSFKVSFIRG